MHKWFWQFQILFLFLQEWTSFNCIQTQDIVSLILWHWYQTYKWHFKQFRHWFIQIIMYIIKSSKTCFYWVFLCRQYIYIDFVCLFRARGNKETLAKMAGDITESLMSLNRTMASQVQHSETTMTALGCYCFWTCMDGVWLGNEQCPLGYPATAKA